MVLPFEWSMLFAFAMGAAAYFSYKSGFAKGTEYGVDAIINDLAAKGIVEIEYEEEISED